MPVVELDYSRLGRLVGNRVARKSMIEALPHLGLDIEGRTDASIRVEYSPNRPDYSTEYGIAMGLQGLLGVKTGPVVPALKKSSYRMRADASVSSVRPYVTGLVAKGEMDEHTLKQLISMQEDLHMGLGRGRARSAIGLHDLGAVSFPLRYTTTGRAHRFAPLGSEGEAGIGEILSDTRIGRDYGHLLGRARKVPLIVDSENSTISLPPIINAATTAVTTATRGLFVEVTGMAKTAIEDVLSVIALTLHGAGFELYEVGVSGSGNSTPKFGTRKIKLNPELVRTTLGLELSAGRITSLLKKSRLDAIARKGHIECVIPRHRFDILGPMDVVEEVLLGYGVANIRPVLSPPATLGGKHPSSVLHESARSVMTGLGYIEALNSSLTGRSTLYGSSGRDDSGAVEVLNSKSAEHTVLRDSLLPGLVASFSQNIQEPYPQRLFEIGTVFGGGLPPSEGTCLCAASSHGAAGFSEIKSALQSVIRLVLGKECKTRTSTHHYFEAGRSADITVEGAVLGVVGEISTAMKGSLKLREPVAAFELNLPD